METAEFVPTSRDSRWCFGKMNYANFVHALYLTMFQPAHIKTGKTTKAGTHEGNCREINGKPRSTIRPCKSNVMKQAANVKGYLFSFTSADVQHEQAAHC